MYRRYCSFLFCLFFFIGQLNINWNIIHIWSTRNNVPQHEAVARQKQQCIFYDRKESLTESPKCLQSSFTFDIQKLTGQW